MADDGDMADESVSAEEGEQNVAFPIKNFRSILSDPSIANIFANNVWVDVNEYDVSIVLMYDYRTPDGKQSKPLARVAMSHASFIVMADFMGLRAKFLKTLHGGLPRSIYQVDESLFEKALREMYDLPEDVE